MKKLFVISIACLSLMASLDLNACCSRCKVRHVVQCNPYVSRCQCADPYCTGADIDCMSRARCCEAFGNIGSR